MIVYCTSDEHYGHKNIIAHSGRPFADVDHMARELIARHNAIVRSEDTVWHLGDFTLDERQVAPMLKQLNGTHHLVSGNHDKSHPCHLRNARNIRNYLEYGFASVQSQATLGPFVLNHLPYVGDSGHHERYVQWRPKDQGTWLLHGHVHEAWRVRGRMINVGVDQWDFAPVRLTTLENIANGVSI